VQYSLQTSALPEMESLRAAAGLIMTNNGIGFIQNGRSG
jgi:hypothetical protein